MNLSNELFYNYFSNRIDKNMYIKQLGIQEDAFLQYLFGEIDNVVKDKKTERLEYLLHALFIWDDVINNQSELVKYIDTINNLLLMDWHNQHENLVNLIQKISHESSLNYLEKAIGMKFVYMEWDDNYSFEKKCIRAIFYIGKKESISILKRVMESDIEEISNLAERELKKLNYEND